MMALVAMIITGFVGMLFGFGFGGSVLYCGIGLVVFMLLTAYDTGCSRCTATTPLMLRWPKRLPSMAR